MKILAISNQSPFPKTSGVSVRNSLFLEALADTHSVDLLIQEYADEVVPQLFNQVFYTRKAKNTGLKMACSLLSSRNSVYNSRFYNQESHDLIQTVLNEYEYDLILAEALPAMINIPKQCTVPIWLDEHNMEYIIYSEYTNKYRSSWMKHLIRREVQKLKLEEEGYLQTAELVSVCSKIDKEHIPGVLRESVQVIPNTCADSAVATSVEVSFNAESPLIIYSGTMNWHPNIDACHYFLDSIFPLIRTEIPQARFCILGKNPDDSLIDKVKEIPGAFCTGFVDDIGEYMHEASLCVVPLRMGSGTRIKILEAARLGLPVVSTSKGAEGLEFSHQSDISISDTAENFAEKSIKILQNIHCWQKMARNSKKVFLDKYDRTYLKKIIRGITSELVLG